MANQNTIGFNQSSAEICFGTPPNRICIPIGTAPTFPILLNDPDRVNALAAGNIHGKQMRESLKRFELAGRDKGLFWKGECHQLLAAGQISV